MTDVPPLLNKGGAAPDKRAALTSALLVVLSAMKKAGMVGDVVTLLDCECPDAINGAEFRPVDDAGQLARDAAAVLNGAK